MIDDTWQVEQFERARPQLRAVAYRMLGSLSDADDAVQEAWLRLHRSDDEAIRNMDAWLTTVVGRVCIDMLRARQSRREGPTSGPGCPSPSSATTPSWDRSRRRCSVMRSVWPCSSCSTR